MSFERQFQTIKQQATPLQLYALLFDLPKGGDLHNHLDGSILPQWWFEEATNPRSTNNETFYVRWDDCHTLPQWAYQKSPEETLYQPLISASPQQQIHWLKSLELDYQHPSCEDFFEVIFPRLRNLRHNLPLTGELLIKNLQAFAAEKLLYLETIMNPFHFQDGSGNYLDAEEVAVYFRQRLQQPDAIATGITVRFQIFIFRAAEDAELQIEKAYDFIDKNPDLWVGVNLVGREEDERGNPQRFLPLFQRLNRHYPRVKLSLHAGESSQPNFNVRNTLALGASRIGHGINLIDDPETMQQMQENSHLVEINLISNLLLGYVPTIDEHPFPIYLRRGLPVCLNTDDRGIFGTQLTDEYYTAVTHFDLTWSELVRLGEDSLIHAFLEPELKSQLLERYRCDLQAFEDKYRGEDWRDRANQTQPTLSRYAREVFKLSSSDRIR